MFKDFSWRLQSIVIVSGLWSGLASHSWAGGRPFTGHKSGQNQTPESQIWVTKPTKMLPLFGNRWEISWLSAIVQFDIKLNINGLGENIHVHFCFSTSKTSNDSLG